MRLLPILLLLLLSQTKLHSQRLFQHPVFPLIGPEFTLMSDYNSGLFRYQGSGTLRFRETTNFLRQRRIELLWSPLQYFSNGFGSYLLAFGHQGLQLSHSAGQTDASGGYTWTLPKDIMQSIGFQSQWRQQWKDENRDGFNDYQNGRHHHIIHNLWHYYRGWGFSVHSTYLNARQYQGQEGFQWPEHQLSDSVYGFGSETEQWRTLLRARKKYSKGDLNLVANFQGREENGAYGQRALHARETRQGFAANYQHRETKHESAALVFAERQQVEQAWDNWRDDQNWSHIGLGLHHQRFLTGNWLLKASAMIDYHSLTNWQVLPSLRMDYLRIKLLRTSVMAGRDYRIPRILEEGERYLASQRAWEIGDWQADQVWFISAGLQSKIYRIGPIQQQFKVSYRLQDYQQRLLIDPSLEQQVLVTMEDQELPRQHLIISTLQSQYRKWKWANVFVWRDVQLPYESGHQQSFFSSRMASLNSLTFLHRPRERKKQIWDFRLDHLWRSPQPLPNGDQSPHLQDLRIHVETGRTITSKGNGRIFLFAGAENLLNQQQEILFQQPSNPFAADFDGSARWGDTLGRRWYVGVRLQP